MNVTIWMWMPLSWYQCFLVSSINQRNAKGIFRMCFLKVFIRLNKPTQNRFLEQIIQSLRVCEHWVLKPTVMSLRAQIYSYGTKNSCVDVQAQARAQTLKHRVGVGFRSRAAMYTRLFLAPWHESHKPESVLLGSEICCHGFSNAV